MAGARSTTQTWPRTNSSACCSHQHVSEYTRTNAQARSVCRGNHVPHEGGNRGVKGCDGGVGDQARPQSTHKHTKWRRCAPYTIGSTSHPSGMLVGSLSLFVTATTPLHTPISPYVARGFPYTHFELGRWHACTHSRVGVSNMLMSWF